MILASGLSRITDIITVIGIIIVVLVLIGTATFVYFYKFRKTKNDIKEENKDYSNLIRRDAKDYIKIDDIKDNMIIAGNRFTAAITCLGNDFFDLTGEERLSIKNNYTAFIGSFREPVVYRQSTKAVDLVGHIKQYEDRISRVRELCVKYSVDYEDLKLEAGRLKREGDLNSLEIVLNAMSRVERQIQVHNDRLERLEEQLRFIRICANGTYAADTEELYVFSWEYSGGMEGFLHEPSKEEIYQKAISELNSKASAFINALANAKVTARRCTTKELELVAYRYFHPVTGVFIADSAYGNSSDFVDIVTDGDDDGILEDFINEQSIQLAHESAARYMDNVEAVLYGSSDGLLEDEESVEENAELEPLVNDDVAESINEELLVPLSDEVTKEEVEEEYKEDTLEAFIKKPVEKKSKESSLFEL